jgi:hypothetical protein
MTRPEIINEFCGRAAGRASRDNPKFVWSQSVCTLWRTMCANAVQLSANKFYRRNRHCELVLGVTGVGKTTVTNLLRTIDLPRGLVVHSVSCADLPSSLLPANLPADVRKAERVLEATKSHLYLVVDDLEALFYFEQGDALLRQLHAIGDSLLGRIHCVATGSADCLRELVFGKADLNREKFPGYRGISLNSTKFAPSQLYPCLSAADFARLLATMSVNIRSRPVPADTAVLFYVLSGGIPGILDRLLSCTAHVTDSGILNQLTVCAPIYTIMPKLEECDRSSRVIVRSVVAAAAGAAGPGAAEDALPPAEYERALEPMCRLVETVVPLSEAADLSRIHWLCDHGILRLRERFVSLAHPMAYFYAETGWSRGAACRYMLASASRKYTAPPG